MDYLEEEFDEVKSKLHEYKKVYGDNAPASWEDLFESDEQMLMEERDRLKSEIDRAIAKVEQVTRDLKSKTSHVEPEPIIREVSVGAEAHNAAYNSWMESYIKAGDTYSRTYGEVYDRAQDVTRLKALVDREPRSVVVSETEPTEGWFKSMLRRLGGERPAKEEVIDEPTDGDNKHS